MGERIELVHGTLDLRSRPGGRTTVYARIPIVRRHPAIDLRVAACDC
jgi:hypothetical protein